MEAYKRKVFDYLNKLEPNLIIDLHVLCHPSTESEFVSCVKEYIDNIDCEIEFNTDYSKLRRLPYEG